MEPPLLALAEPVPVPLPDRVSLLSVRPTELAVSLERPLEDISLLEVWLTLLAGVLTFPLDELELLSPLTPLLPLPPLPLPLPPASDVLPDLLLLSLASTALAGWACRLGPRVLRLELPSFHLGTCARGEENTCRGLLRGCPYNGYCSNCEL